MAVSTGVAVGVPAAWVGLPVASGTGVGVGVAARTGVGVGVAVAMAGKTGVAGVHADTNKATINKINDRLIGQPDNSR